jgi:hypothetical protein
MKLTVRNVKTEFMREAMPMLCDEAGKPLPGQRAVTVKSSIDDVTTLLVEFVVIGDIEVIENT